MNISIRLEKKKTIGMLNISLEKLKFYSNPSEDEDIVVSAEKNLKFI